MLEESELTLTPIEFKAQLALMGLSQQDFAKAIDMSLRTVQRWLNETIVPKYAVICLRYIQLKKPTY